MGNKADADHTPHEAFEETAVSAMPPRMVDVGRTTLVNLVEAIGSIRVNEVMRLMRLPDPLLLLSAQECTKSSSLVHARRLAEDQLIRVNAAQPAGGGERGVELKAPTMQVKCAA